MKTFILAEPPNENFVRLDIGRSSETVRKFNVSEFGLPGFVHTQWIPTPGLNLILGRSGGGKSTFIRGLIKEIGESEQSGDVFLLNMGEPLINIPFSTNAFEAACLIAHEEAMSSGKWKYLLIDSLIGIWSDAELNKSSPLGRGGISYGVTQYLANQQNRYQQAGLVIISVINPELAEIDSLLSGLTGVSSSLINLDSNVIITRKVTDFDPISENFNSIRTVNSSSLMTQTLAEMREKSHSTYNF